MFFVLTFYRSRIESTLCSLSQQPTAKTVNTHICYLNSTNKTVIMMKFQRVFLWAAVLSLANISDVVSAANTNKRRSSEELKRLVENPKLGDHIKGKTLRELGVKPSSALRQGGRRDAEPSSDFHLFSIYEEFGPSVSRLGETAGLRGYIFDYSKYGQDEPLSEYDVIGALRGTCSVVGGANGEDHFCTYEILIRVEEGYEGFGTVIASGSLTYEVEDGGYLIVEGLGNDFEYREQGGICTLTYRATGMQNVLEIDIDLQ